VFDLMCTVLFSNHVGYKRRENNDNNTVSKVGLYPWHVKCLVIATEPVT
jgi:hypothetical protein